jgi:hypothetical protein
MTRIAPSMKGKGSEINWFDVDRVSKPGEYDFRDGIIQIRRKHLDIWKNDPAATLTLVRFVPTIGTRQTYGLSDNLVFR